MKTSQLIPFIRHIINEAATVSDEFTIETDAALSEFVLAAMKQIVLLPGYQTIPVTMEGKENISFHQRPDGLYYAIVKAPDDFLAPSSINLEGWVTPVYTFLPVTDSLYQAQLSSAKGVGNGPHLPIAFLVSQQDTIVVAHAVHTPGTCEFRYIPLPSIDDEGVIRNFQAEKYRECLAYTAAALYLQSVNEYDAAKVAFDTAGAYIQSINKQET